MAWMPRPSRQAVVRACLWGALLSATTQLTAATAVVVADEIRRHRKPLLGTFPRMAPKTTMVAGSSVTTYTYGEHLYADMLQAIRGAQESILFETFIWKSDRIGEEFKQALIEAAERGVRVYVVYDGFANLVVDPRFYNFPESMYVVRFPALRPGMLTGHLRYFGRDHRKILVIDHEIGFLGGYNIGELYATSWRDTHLRVVGSAVWEIENAFVDFWNAVRHDRHPELPDRGAKAWEPRIRASRNAPSRMLFPVRGLYLEAIDRATSRIYITQAYFLPDQEILQALQAAAGRGVDVRIVIPEFSNHVVADWAARGYYTTLLESGITLWLYQNAMVHAKTATVDGRWSTVGTANIDRLSLLGNYEVNLELFSDDQAARMEEIFETDLTNCRQLTLAEWQERGLPARIAERILSYMQPLL